MIRFFVILSITTLCQWASAKQEKKALLQYCPEGQEWAFTSPLCNYGLCDIELADVETSEQCVVEYNKCHKSQFGVLPSPVAGAAVSGKSGWKESGKYSYNKKGGQGGWCDELAMSRYNAVVGQKVQYQGSYGRVKVAGSKETSRKVVEAKGFNIKAYTAYQYQCDLQLVRDLPVVKADKLCGVKQRKECISINTINCQVAKEACVVSFEPPTLKQQLKSGLKANKVQHQFRISGVVPRQALLNNRHIRMFAHTIQCVDKLN